MSRESDLIQLWLKWVESELSEVSKFGFWVESELSQVSKFGIWVESELSHLDCHISQSRVSPKKWVEHNPADITITITISKWNLEWDVMLIDQLWTKNMNGVRILICMSENVRVILTTSEAWTVDTDNVRRGGKVSSKQWPGEPCRGSSRTRRSGVLAGGAGHSREERGTRGPAGRAECGRRCNHWSRSR